MNSEFSRRKSAIPKKLSAWSLPIDMSIEKENNIIPENMKMEIINENSKFISMRIMNNCKQENFASEYESSEESPDLILANHEQLWNESKHKLHDTNGNDTLVDQRRRQYNVEVDPAKYRRIFDVEKGGVRYACSICGNVYKWRKSLNKHWKEKHRSEIPPPLDAPVPIKGHPHLSSNGYVDCDNSETLHPAFALNVNTVDLLPPNMQMYSASDDIRECFQITPPITELQESMNFSTFSEYEQQPLDLSGKTEYVEQSKIRTEAEISTDKTILSPQPVTSGNPKYFICSVCHNKCPSLENANEHFQINHIHELEREISGKSPPRNTNVAQQNEEWRLSDPTNPLKCVQCDFIGRWPTELQKHAASHSSMRPFKCLICSLTYKWRWDLAKHFDRAHPNFTNPYKKRDRDQAKTIIEQKSQINKVCDNFVVETESLKRKLSSQPSEDNDGNVIEQTLAQFTENCMTLQPKQNSDRKGFSCNWCDYQGRWRSELFQHMRCYHARDKPYHCSACTYSSNWKWDVQKHVRKQHSVPTSSDTIIQSAQIIEIPDQFLFNPTVDENFVELNVHDESLRIKLLAVLRKSQSPYCCGQCPYVANCPSEYKRHLIVHSDAKPYRCYHCKYQNKWKCDVKKHMKTEKHQGPVLLQAKKFLRKRAKIASKNDADDFIDNGFDEAMDEIDIVGTDWKSQPLIIHNGETYIVMAEDDSDTSLDTESLMQDHFQCQENTFKCIACDTQATIFELYDHFISAHLKMTNFTTDKQWTCPVCLENLGSFVNAIYHARSHLDLDLVEDEYLYSGLGIWDQSNADAMASVPTLLPL